MSRERLVPGVRAAQTRAAADLPGASRTAYLHRTGEFAFDGALRDIASTHDAATATWVATSLQYPRPTLPDDAGRWPWVLATRGLLLATAGGVLALLALRLRRGRRRRP